MEQLLREGQWGEATRIYADLLATAAASGDDGALRRPEPRLGFLFPGAPAPDLVCCRQPETGGDVLRRPGGNANGTIILSHGSNAWGQNHPFVVMTALEMARRGYEVFTFDYRGFGASQDPLRLDAAAAPYFPMTWRRPSPASAKRKTGKPGASSCWGTLLAPGRPWSAASTTPLSPTW